MHRPRQVSSLLKCRRRGPAEIPLPCSRESRASSLQESLALRVKEMEQAAEARVAVERQDSLRQVLAKEQLAERAAAALSDAQSQLETLQQQHAALSDDHSAAVAESASLRVRPATLCRSSGRATAKLTVLGWTRSEEQETCLCTHWASTVPYPKQVSSE